MLKNNFCFRRGGGGQNSLLTYLFEFSSKNSIGTGPVDVKGTLIG